MTLDGSFCCHHLPGKKVWDLVHFFIWILFRNIRIFIWNVHRCACVFYMVHVEFIQIMYGYVYHVWTYHNLSPFASTSRSLGTFCFPFDRFLVFGLSAVPFWLSSPASPCQTAGTRHVVFLVYLFTLVPWPHLQWSHFVLGKKS